MSFLPARRNVLDFDFEKLCSVSMSNQNVYACLVTGKYVCHIVHFAILPGCKLLARHAQLYDEDHRSTHSFVLL